MRYGGLIIQIAFSGVFSALAIVLGFFAKFDLFGGHIYLIGIALFLAPIVLKLPFSIIVTSISILIVDWYSGWIAYTWISIIAYVSAIAIINVFKLFKTKILYIVFTLIGSIIIIMAFYALESIVFEKSQVINDLIATSIQMAIVLLTVWILYLPIRLLKII